MAPAAVIFGCQGPELGPNERRFFAEAAPWGFILFARNIETPAQVRRLTAELREVVGRDAPVLIDQEGGRVARLRGPEWREWVPAREECAHLPDTEARARAMYLRYWLIADELRAVGIDVNCAPVLDLLRPETHSIIAGRSYGADPAEVAVIGRAVADGLMAGGVAPVMKHVPGHGRATADSHEHLPRVSVGKAELAVDFTPFQALNDLPMAMSAHVVFEDIDAERPGTLSPAVVATIRGEIGFGGLLMTDDLSMGALSGPLETRAGAALAAGCDMILHCNGDMAEMAAVAGAVPALAGRAAERADRALMARGQGAPEDAGALEAEFIALREQAGA